MTGGRIQTHSSSTYHGAHFHCAYIFSTIVSHVSILVHHSDSVYHPENTNPSLVGSLSVVNFQLPIVPVKATMAFVHPFGCTVKVEVFGELLAQRTERP